MGGVEVRAGDTSFQSQLQRTGPWVLLRNCLVKVKRAPRKVNFLFRQVLFSFLKYLFVFIDLFGSARS